MRRHASWAFVLLLLGASLQAESVSYEMGGHLKVRGGLQAFPDDSLIHDLTGSGAKDLTGEFRLLFSADRGNWDAKADGQLLYLIGDTVEYTRELAEQAPGYEQLFGRLPNDDRRWWDLTNTIEDDNKLALVARLDRLSVGYTGAQMSLRFGRQAISWGNGLFFAPMDIVNPFDPTQVDTEFKAGDDMLYGQYLFAGGNDMQATYVVRRDLLTGDVNSDQATLAAKYHGFGGLTEYDLLVAQHYDELLLAVGGGRDVGGAVVRADAVFSDTDSAGWEVQWLVNTSYSWVAAGKNMTGSAEYFYNGFGQDDGCYSPACLAANPELIRRVERRQLYNLGRHYLAANVMVELTPLFSVTPNLFWNLGDGSALLQIVTQNSLGDNLVLLGALGIPMGPNGTEYGGIDTGLPGRYFSSDLSVFLQIGWYF